MKTKLLISSLFAFFLLLLANDVATAQSQEVMGKKVEKSRGQSKYQRPTEDKAAEKPSKSRGTCCIDFDNYTGYYIDVWVDGEYRGRVAPWDNGGICVYSGWTTWHAETAGGTYYWEGSGECSGDYILNLKD